jgi:segregation and condensation protein B
MAETLLRGVIEALLFVSDEPLTPRKIAHIIGEPEGEVTTTLRALEREYADADRGFQVRSVAGGWRLYTHPAYHEYIEELVLSWDTRRLSQASLEALAVVAYHQPVTRGGINAVRGVNSEAVVASLVEKGLIKEVGRDPEAGNAMLFGTTRTFLEKFGLGDIGDLPPLEEFAPDATTEKAIRERLFALEGPDLAGDEEDLTVD